jgi:tetratricopeptide (TPR) repeat protein
MHDYPRPLLLLACVTLLGCQQPGAGRQAAAAVAPAIWYTHAGAEALYHAARYDDAEAMCRQAIATIEKSAGKKAPALAEPLNDLATIYMRQARFADAKGVLDRAESVLDPKVPAQALILGRLGINKGWRLYSLGESDGAEKVFEESRELLEKNQKGESKDLAEIINNLALMYEQRAGDNDDAALQAQARRMLLEAWQMRRRVTGEVSPETGESLNNLGMNLLLSPQRRSDLDQAMVTLRKSLEVSLKVYGEQSPETAVSRTNLAMACLLQNDAEEAEKQLRMAIPITLRFLGKTNPDRAYELTALGRILQEQTHYDEAEKAFTEVVQINEAVYGKSHPNVASALEYLQHLYEAKGDQAKQIDIQRRIEKLSDKGI